MRAKRRQGRTTSAKPKREKKKGSNTKEVKGSKIRLVKRLSLLCVSAPGIKEAARNNKKGTQRNNED